ncbi:MAG: substrate-binding domain-containing protein [Opitutales bacterium]|nr:substrate-binding domain-containing protein [Opitutales bacterium]
MSFHWNRELLPGIARFARSQGDWQLVRLDSPKIPLEGPLPDGMIGIFSKADAEVCDRLQAAGVPMVGVSGFQPLETFPVVTHDDLEIGRMAARYLARTPVRNYIVVGIPQGMHSHLREEGFREELQRLKVDRPVHLVSSYKEELQLLKSLKAPTGVFAVNDQRALHFQKKVQAAGLSMPTDFLILGVDNDSVFCELCPVPLSSISLQFEQVGYQAALTLQQLMEGEKPAHPIVRIPPKEVTVRRSTEYLIVEDVLVRRALALMKEQLATISGFGQLAQMLGVSRRHLEYRFSAATGDSPGKTLRRLRMEQARHLLLTRPMRIQEIAEAVGIGDVNRFSTYFRKTYGMPPSIYRNSQR